MDLSPNFVAEADAVEQDVGENDESEFEIPELPVGETLLFELLSSWGDDYFMGLSAIELFSADGLRPTVVDIQKDRGWSQSELIAFAAFAYYGLCKYRTDEHGSSVHIFIRFESPQTLAMMRILNYVDRSRVHALRGVRNLRIWLDQQCIFRGEICCAFDCADTQQGDNILFTTNEEILAQIAEHDERMESRGDEGFMGLSDNKNVKDEESETIDIEKREAANLGVDQQLAMLAIQQQGASDPMLHRISGSNRPTTGHSSSSSSGSSTAAGIRQKQPTFPNAGESSTTANEPKLGGEISSLVEAGGEEEENAFVGRLFHMELLANWGCPDAIGLAGIQFLGPHFEPLEDFLTKDCVVRCEPNAGAENGSTESLPNLLNGRNLCCRAEEMWLHDAWNPLGPPLMLSFSFPHEVHVTGMSVWNFNASPELSYAGVRCARFYANGRPMSVGVVLLRKAPGYVFFDFVQDILFDRCPLVRQPSTRPQTKSIAGCKTVRASLGAVIFQLRLLTSWGDEFYIGLNGIELFNRADRPIRLRPQNLAAFPESVNCLASVNGDPRTSDKLIDGVNNTTKAHHIWLTPILPNSCARIFIIFDTPTFVTRIRIHNYRKTPERGVRHIALSVDDLLLCSGTEVPIGTADNAGILDIPLRDSE